MLLAGGLLLSEDIPGTRPHVNVILVGGCPALPGASSTLGGPWGPGLLALVSPAPPHRSCALPPSLLQELSASFAPLMEWAIDRLEPTKDMLQLVSPSCMLLTVQKGVTVASRSKQSKGC